MLTLFKYRCLYKLKHAAKITSIGDYPWMILLHPLKEINRIIRKSL
mgnify:CR=1 FL=1